VLDNELHTYQLSLRIGLVELKTVFRNSVSEVQLLGRLVPRVKEL